MPPVPLTNNEKAWAAFAIGTIVAAINIVAAVMTAGTAQIVLLAIGGIVGTIGNGLGVYQITNSVKPPKVD
jgi:hypothetical protein